MAKLYHALNSGGTAAVAQAVSGLGGIGKTALAIAYAHQYGAEYDYRLFCLADSVASLNAGYRAMASELALPIPADAPADVVVDAVKQWLETRSSYLLILDNADFGKTLSVTDLAVFLPAPPSGHVLLTTRAQSLHGSLNITRSHVLQLGMLAQGEAVAFLTGRVCSDDSMLTENEAEAATELAEELGYLALALEQAAAFIARPGRTFRNYLNQYRKHPIQQSEKAKPEAGGYEKTVATTWQISFDEVERECLAATELLTLSAYLAPDDIPAEIVIAATKGTLHALQEFFASTKDNDEKQERYTDLLEPLTRYSLVTVDTATRTYSVHRLVQAVVRHKQNEDEQDISKCQAIEAVNTAFPLVKFENWTLCERLIPCAIEVTSHSKLPTCRNDATSQLLNKVAFYLNARGRYREAEPMLEEALAICREVLPEQHLDTAMVLNDLASLYKAQSRFEEAEPMYIEALVIRRNLLVAKHSSIATSIGNLASLYNSQHRFNEAEPLFLEALAIHREVLPQNHPDIAHSLNNLAYLYNAQNRLDESELLYKESLAIFGKTLRPNHPDIATILNNLAVLHQDQNRFDEAQSLYEQALAIRREVLPQKHPDTAYNLDTLASLHEAQNRLDEAESMYTEALAIRREVLPTNHPHIVLSLNNLAALYTVRNCPDKAELMYLEVMKIMREDLGCEHLNTKVV